MTITTVPYAKLRAPDEINAREEDGYDQKSIGELAALIDAVGLLQPLIVRPAPKGFYDIIAGKRRYLAIGQLITDLKWSVGKEVPVTLRDDNDAEALETSLIENIARKQMHPVQELEIFARVHSEGSDVREIAKRYGVTEKHVEQTLALGALAPEILEAWRSGEISRDVAEAFTICRDRKKQAAAYKDIKKGAWNGIRASDVRHFFRKDKPKLTDGRVKLVGLEVYRDAGGKFTAGLFDDGFIEDEDLLDELAGAALQAKCDELVDEGWSWACPVSDIKPSYAHHSWARVKGKKVLTPEAKTRLEEINSETGKLEAENDDDRHDERLEALEAERAEIEAEASRNGFSKKQKAEAGCIIFIEDAGLRIEYGYLRKTEAQVTREKEKVKKKKAADAAIARGEELPPEEPEISQKLLEDITALQTKAVAEALAQCPQLAVQIAAAALTVGAPSYGDMWPVRLNPDGMKKSGFNSASEDDDGFNEDEEPGFASVLASVPKDRAAAILAVNLGRALDLRRRKFAGVGEADAAALVGFLPGAIYLKAMRETFDASDYFARGSAKIAIAALEDMEVPFERGAKKPVLAEAAAEAANTKGWLPAELRHPDYALIGAKRTKRAA